VQDQLVLALPHEDEDKKLKLDDPTKEHLQQKY
jgi:hypothetical protein